MNQKIQPPAPLRKAWRAIGPVLGAGLFFVVDCLCSAATIKKITLLLILLTLCSVFLFYERLRDRLKPPMLALGLYVIMDGLSLLYAASGKFALNEFTKVLSAFCLAMLLLAFISDREPERQAAAVLEGCCAIAGLVSIDLVSTHWISTPVLSFLAQFTPDYQNLDVAEESVRLLSMFEAPNPFAGFMGIGVLLSLGLAASEERPKVRCVHLVCLSVNALAFILVFSMGACVAIVPAFLVFLALTAKDSRMRHLFLMVETLLVTVLAAFPISVTSITAWTGEVRPIPLLCALGGAAALCALDLLVGQRLAVRLAGQVKAVPYFIAGILAVLAVFLAAACNLTTGAALQAGDSLRRSAYPAPGTYTLAAEGSGDPMVTIKTQNKEDTMMHTETRLYRGPLSQAAFDVPEDSLVVWFEFWAAEDIQLDRVEYSGENGSGSVPLDYVLLPGFIANRLQGLRANQNAIQRFVFFEDGLKLFLRSPVIGLGLGGFENAVRGVQAFRYATKYVHNHYIQAMADTGIIGLALFLGLLAVSALAVWRGRGKPLAPALGAALLFTAAHCAVEVDFSYYAFLPIGFGLFAVISLCCGSDVPLPAWADRKGLRTGALLGASALMALFGVLLGRNISAQNMVAGGANLAQLEQAADMDPFEWADYMFTYVVRVTGADMDDATRATADEYAARLEKTSSNVVPLYLAEYYFTSDRTERGFEMVERYVNYVAADEAAWQKAFALLEKHEQDTESFRTGAAHIAELLDTWNEENMGFIALDEQALAFIQRMRS